MREGQRPVAVGFFFSLGHSTIVVIASAATALATGALQDRFALFKAVGGVIGTLVSASFLFLVVAASRFCSFLIQNKPFEGCTALPTTKLRDCKVADHPAASNYASYPANEQ